MKKFFVGLLVAVAVSVVAPAGVALGDVVTADPTSACCMGIEAAALSPLGSSDEALGGILDIKLFLEETVPGTPPGLAFFSIAAQLHETSHVDCDEALES